MAWFPGFVEFESSLLKKQDYFEANIQIAKMNQMVFYGMVTEADGNKPVPGALVKVFARLSNNQELPLSHSISGADGHYLLHVNKDLIPDGTTAIIVRASAAYPSSSTS